MKYTDNISNSSIYRNYQENESELNNELYTPPIQLNHLNDTPIIESLYLVNAIDFITNVVSWQMWREKNFYKTSIRMTIGLINKKWDELNEKEKCLVRELISNKQQCFLSNILYNKFFPE
jgi:hypothetical protein